MKVRIGLALLGSLGLLAMSTPAQAGAATDALWEMNESSGTTVMRDSSGVQPALDGAVNPSGVVANGEYYHWQQRCPACLPVDTTRIVQVPDNPRLEIPDPSVTYTLEFRYKTRSSVGNIMQKGQSGTVGGQIKVQLPNGTPQCLFKGANGVRVGTGSRVNLSDGNWHIVKCVHTANRVTEFVDGAQVSYKNGSTGPINNAKPFVVGGKLSCDQGNTTCDYYSGDIDWIRISHG